MLTALTLALAIAAAPAPTVRDGIAAWQKGDYSTAVAAWRPLAEDGDADAAFNLGQAYRLGRGVPVNLAAAQTWLQRAADQGHLDAQTTLGLLQFNNGNRVAGLRWLRAAAEKGEPRAMLVYGTALFNGDGVARDPVLAYAFVSRAAAQGFAAAKSTLAQMDQIIPVEDRQKGVALAMEKASAGKAAPAKPASGKTAKAVKTPKAQPTPKPATVASSAASAAAAGGWRIQLGAFSKRSSAEALFAKLSGGAPVAGRSAYYIPAGAVTRLQVGPFGSRSEASAACAALTRRGQGCFPVAGK